MESTAPPTWAAKGTRSVERSGEQATSIYMKVTVPGTLQQAHSNARLHLCLQREAATVAGQSVLYMESSSQC